MTESLLYYRLPLVILGFGVLALGFAIGVMPAKAAKKSEAKVYYGVDKVYYKERLARLTAGSRYGNNATICHEVLTAYYERKTQEEVKKALQTIHTHCRFPK